MMNIDAMLTIARIFENLGGDYFPNYLYPESWNEKCGYYIENYYKYSPCGLSMRHKYLAKQYTEKWVGKQYVVPTYGVWDKADDVDWEQLPNSFVLKSCIGFQGKHVIVVRDKEKVDKDKILNAVQGYIDEQCSGFLHKKIIAEMLLLNDDGSLPYQYEFFCGRGKPMICRTNHHSPTELDTPYTDLVFYDIQNWIKLPIQFFGESGPAPNDEVLSKPENLDEMIKIATGISSYFPICRIDLYTIGNKVYVGEITTQPGGGFSPIKPVEYDFRLGQGVEVLAPREIERMIKNDFLEFPLDEINGDK